MAARGTEHEPPAVWATVAVVLGAVAFYMGIIIPAAGALRHTVFGLLFGVVAALAGCRGIGSERRNRARLGRRGRSPGARVWAWTGLVLAVLGLGMTLWQVAGVLTHGAVPPVFWSPYRTG